MAIECRERISAWACTSALDTFCGWEISYAPECHDAIRSIFEHNWQVVNEKFRLALVWPKRGLLVIVTDYPQSEEERENAFQYITSLIKTIE
jgi:hypothetical protein